MSSYYDRISPEQESEFLLELERIIEDLQEIQAHPDYVDGNLSKYEDTMKDLIRVMYQRASPYLFYEIDGRNLIIPLLRSKHAIFRSSSATIIFYCCTTNPAIQQLSLMDEVFIPLMEMTASDPSNEVRYQAVTALAAIVRSNPHSIDPFMQLDGIKLIKRSLKSTDNNIVNGTTCLVMALCDADEMAKKTVTKSGIVVRLIALLQFSDTVLKDNIFMALLSVCVNNPKAQKICQRYGVHESFSDRYN